MSTRSAIRTASRMRCGKVPDRDYLRLLVSRFGLDRSFFTKTRTIARSRKYAAVLERLTPADRKEATSRWGWPKERKKK